MPHYTLTDCQGRTYTRKGVDGMAAARAFEVESGLSVISMRPASPDEIAEPSIIKNAIERRRHVASD